jgi:hypothetical protein
MRVPAPAPCHTDERLVTTTSALFVCTAGSSRFQPRHPMVQRADATISVAAKSQQRKNKSSARRPPPPRDARVRAQPGAGGGHQRLHVPRQLPQARLPRRAPRSRARGATPSAALRRRSRAGGRVQLGPTLRCRPGAARRAVQRLRVQVVASGGVMLAAGARAAAAHASSACARPPAVRPSACRPPVRLRVYVLLCAPRLTRALGAARLAPGCA